MTPTHSKAGELHSAVIGRDRTTSLPLVKCVHCGYRWLHGQKTGHIRGFCTNCNGLVCGRACCVTQGCVSEQQRLDNMEAGLSFWSDHKPIQVSVPRTIIKGHDLAAAP